MVVSFQKHVNEHNARVDAALAEIQAEIGRRTHLELFLQDLLADLLAL